MPFLPDWAPNVHPLIVHFPIALLIAALVFDFAALILKNRSWPRLTAGSLYILGALAAVVAYLTGREAADSVSVPALANPTLSHHSDWALFTVWFFGVYAVIRLFFLRKKLARNTVASILVFVIGVIGIYLLYETAEHGAELVFRYGVGVKVAEEAQLELAEKQAREEISAESGVVMQENGSWLWNPGHGADIVLREQFNWVRGNPEMLSVQTIHDQNNNEVLALDLQNTSALITAGKPLKSVQAEARINLDQFRGRFMLVHHLQDSLNYDFVLLENGVMKLGRVITGKETVEDQENFQAKGWLTLRVVGEGRHFRGYVNDKLIAHGHADELPPGQVGFFIQGSSTILVDYIKVQALSK